MRKSLRLGCTLVVATAVLGACGKSSPNVAGPTTTLAPAAPSDVTSTSAASDGTTTSIAGGASSTTTTAAKAATTTTTVVKAATTATSSKGISRATPIFPTETTTAAPGSPNTPAPPATGTITVFAASSLTGAYTEIGKAFQAANPDATVRFNFAASSTLATQINQGAPADVFASADDANMKKITDTGTNLGSPVEFATNKLQVIVGKGNPKNITSVTDLAKSGIVTVTCDPSVPIGGYTQQVFQKAGITVKPKSFEPDVKGIVTKVTNGEADTGVVYATDVLAAGTSAQGVAIPDEWNVIANYPLSVVRGTHDAYSAQLFMNYVLGKDGQAILAKWAFTGP